MPNVDRNLSRLPAGAAARPRSRRSGSGQVHDIWSGAQEMRVEYLVIAGGGGGAGTLSGQAGGGGGAGGYRNSFSNETSGRNSGTETPLGIITETDYTVTVGAGGAGGTVVAANVKGTEGSNSRFATITSQGGGLGTTPGSDQTGIDGGCGGGAGGGITTRNGGAGTAAQGFNGGGSFASAINFEPAAGGGGGAGAAGVTATARFIAGNGGAGLSSSITGTAVTRAGGGGGSRCSGAGSGSNGTGGSGVGGDGRTGDNDGFSGTANTGSGGGGLSRTNNTSPGFTAGNGGSGVVIVRYPDQYRIVVGSGLTATTDSPSGGFRVTTFTAGTGTVRWEA